MTVEPIPNEPFAALRGAAFVVLTTYRRSGEPVPTTVWFAAAAGRLYITTLRSAGKVRRLQANPRVTVAPSDHIGTPHGPAIGARARLLSDDEGSCAAEVLRAKYGVQYDSFLGRMDANQPPGSRVFLELEPAE